jgi:hypothetical protein
MERYRDIELDMPDAEALPFWAQTSAEADTEDLAAWLRDVGGDGLSEEPFGTAIDASWLGTAPSADNGEPAEGESGAGSGQLEAGA